MSIKVAILGSGNIARDLYRKIGRSPHQDLFLVAGRNIASPGMVEASNYSTICSDRGILAVEEHANQLDLVYDTTSASSHRSHTIRLKRLELKTVDLTPTGDGVFVVPAVNIDAALNAGEVSLISCGGQSSIPMIVCILKDARKHHVDIEYIELSSTISSKSAGPATRENIDEYILNTEAAIHHFSQIKCKVILNINPAIPPVKMQNSISFKFRGPRNFIENLPGLSEYIKSVQEYVPGYRLVSEPRVIGPDRLFLSLTVEGVGDYLPAYAGNLDIITSAAVAIGDYHERHKKNINP